MTQKQAIEKLARIMCEQYGNDPFSVRGQENRETWTFYRSQAGSEFRRMVNERACAMENAVSAAYLESATQDRVEDFRDNINQYALEATIALIEQLEE